eukprot:759473-Hanusia_phi.AAC.4
MSEGRSKARAGGDSLGARWQQRTSLQQQRTPCGRHEQGNNRRVPTIQGGSRSPQRAPVTTRMFKGILKMFMMEACKSRQSKPLVPARARKFLQGVRQEVGPHGGKRTKRGTNARFEEEERGQDLARESIRAGGGEEGRG